MPWRLHCRRISSLRLRHSQLLLRGGARTPLEPLEPNDFWRAALPTEQLLRRLSISSSEGARRRVRLETIWKQLTARGVDESYALGERLETWLAEQSLKGEDEEEDMPTLLISSPDQRSMLTAQAVLRGLCRSQRQSDAVRMRTMRAALRVPFQEESEDEGEKLDVAMDLTELLGLEPTALEGATWPRLLDVVETASIFGLLPKGELDQAWRAVLAPTYRGARAKLLLRARALLRLTVEPLLACDERERLRVVVMPGYSLLCWACALQLPRLAQLWPPPSSCLLVETLDDEAGAAFVRIWQPRSHLELRPAWHQVDGPIPLERLLQELQLR